MTPEEKAKQLLINLYPFAYVEMGTIDELTQEQAAKELALICVNEIIQAMEAFGFIGCMYNDFETGVITDTQKKIPAEYWQQVEKHIESM